jgi:hypothetical protein
MIESFLNTKSYQTSMFVYVDEKDKFVKQYHEMLVGFGIIHEIGPHKHLCRVDNYASTILYPGLEYYHEVNDDHIFRESGWDIEMQRIIMNNNGWGIVSGEGREHLPTASMMSGNIIEALGYWFPTDFEHHSCDLYIQDIGNECGILLYPKKTLIEHMHFAWGKSKRDMVYDWVYSPPQVDIGTMAYKKWCAIDKAGDILKIKNSMIGGLHG